MILRKWEELPEVMKNVQVQKYYDILSRKRMALLAKRIFDIVLALFLVIVLSPVFLILIIMIKVDSRGPVMFRQVRITQYARKFRIFKFRTMVVDADKCGTQVTVKNDMRITRVGKLLRKSRLDELPQLLNILVGDMTFVGTRPEVEKYVEQYTPEMYATFLLPAGVTSEASIEYKDEDELLENAKNADEVYLKKVLPEKMKYNLEALERYSLRTDIRTMVRTVKAVFK